MSPGQRPLALLLALEHLQTHTFRAYQQFFQLELLGFETDLAALADADGGQRHHQHDAHGEHDDEDAVAHARVALVTRGWAQSTFRILEHWYHDIHFFVIKNCLDENVQYL